MVKYGRHNASVRHRLEQLDNGIYFVLDYNALKEMATDNVTTPKIFQQAWIQQLTAHEVWLKAAKLELYQQVFQAIAHDPKSCGASQEEALRIFVRIKMNATTTTTTTTTTAATTSDKTSDNTTKEKTKVKTTTPTLSSSSDLLRRLKRMELASTNNFQALRKSVKKFDKYKILKTSSPPSSSTSCILLPLLYTTDFKSDFQSDIHIVTREFSKQRGSLIPTWWKLMNTIDSKKKSHFAKPKTSTVTKGGNGSSGGDSSDIAFEKMTNAINDKKRSEIEWLHSLSSSLSDDVRSKLVLHRGFHSYKDSTSRPIENSLTGILITVLHIVPVL
jgi:negative regulator of replication initiation